MKFREVIGVIFMITGFNIGNNGIFWIGIIIATIGACMCWLPDESKRDVKRSKNIKKGVSE